MYMFMCLHVNYTTHDFVKEVLHRQTLEMVTHFKKCQNTFNKQRHMSSIILNKWTERCSGHL